MWLIFLSVLLEPIFFLFSIGIGVGALVGEVTLANGEVVSYRSFVAAGLLATSAMMGPVFDSTFNFFVKLKYFHIYQATLATPMRPTDVVRGEMLWSLLRAAVYADRVPGDHGDHGSHRVVVGGALRYRWPC